MAIETKSKINLLLMNILPGGILFSEGLKKQGYSDQLMKQYRKSGWLTSLSKGVMYRSGDSLSALAALASCQEQTDKQYRVAAHSALELSGYYHFVPMGKPQLIVASNEPRTPQWAKSDLFDMPVVGFENHGGRTCINNCRPLGKVLYGSGNDGKTGYEGVVYKNVIGTYLHGPLLPKNPQLADWLISHALEKKYGKAVELAPLDDSEEKEANDYICHRFVKENIS